MRAIVSITQGAIAHQAFVLIGQAVLIHNQALPCVVELSQVSLSM